MPTSFEDYSMVNYSHRTYFVHVAANANLIRPGALSRACVTALAEHLGECLSGLESRLAAAPVGRPQPRGWTRARLAERFDLERPTPLPRLAAEIYELLYAGIVHTNHRRHFGLFVPSVRAAGVVGDALAALLNPQLGSWWYAPAAGELEAHLLEALAARIGFDPLLAEAHFTSGGSEANATAVLLALTRALPEHRAEGLAGTGARPVLYMSDQAHDSFVKIAQLAGLGRDAVRRVPSDPALRMDLGALRDQLRRDRAAGARPFLVVGTAGTTAAGAFDPLPRLAELCREEGLWFHVDAAWGGMALLVDELRHHAAGIELADSVTWDAHKVLPVPMGAGMFFARSRGWSRRAFGVETRYVPDAAQGTVDLYQNSMQWSRRFIGLKVFLTVAELGWRGIAAMLRRQVEMGRLLREELTRAGFTLVADSPLPLVCFTHPVLAERPADDVVSRLLERGRVWISSVQLDVGGPKALRACVTHHDTGPEDVRAMVAEVAAEVGVESRSASP
jgi:glutamate/tyrosine decarboxylase-like PLP-dependent enzyme